MPTELDRQLDSLRTALATIEPPVRVDDAVRAAIASEGGRTRPRWTTPVWIKPQWFAVLATVAAALAVIAVIDRDPPRLPAIDAGTPAISSESDRAWFLPVVPISELAQVDDALVMPARMSRMTLAQLGLPVNPAQAAEGVETEVLVRPDGALLAVRFIP